MGVGVKGEETEKGGSGKKREIGSGGGGGWERGYGLFQYLISLPTPLPPPFPHLPSTSPVHPIITRFVILFSRTGFFLLRGSSSAW